MVSNPKLGDRNHQSEINFATLLLTNLYVFIPNTIIQFEIKYLF